MIGPVRWGPLVLSGVMVLGLSACRGAELVPAGAHLVHVIVTETSVTIEPSRVPAGDVYLVLDGPILSVSFAQAGAASGSSPGPLTDDDLARLARGDTEGLAIGGFDVGCDDAQRAQDRGKLGSCGNVRKQPLAVGRYAFFLQPAGVGAPVMAVLEVVP